MRNSSIRGFTLIELFVVIATLALLTAFLLPVFVRSREGARIAACQAHLKQIGIAVPLYAQDWDGSMPLPDRPTPFPSPYNPLRVSVRSDILGLQPYLPTRADTVWVCPSDPNAPDECRPPACYYQSYWFSEQLLGAATEGCDPKGAPVLREYDTIPQPSETVMVHEGGYPLPLFPYRPQGIKASSMLEPGIGNFHRGQGNFLFADGHVRLMPLRRTLTPKVLWDRYGDWQSECPEAVGATWTAKDISQTLIDLDRYPSLYAR